MTPHKKPAAIGLKLAEIEYRANSAEKMPTASLRQRDPETLRCRETQPSIL
jgi:hypothetical protein